ncbi:MAG: nicotinamide riboside transporter PnuC [Giesbergeria sp.]
MTPNAAHTQRATFFIGNIDVISSLEVTANIVIALSIVLAGRNSIHTWWTGIVGCALFALLFFQSQLYADVTLQVFFIFTSIWGWRQWAGGQNLAALPITDVPRLKFVAALAVGLMVGTAYAILLKQFTDAFSPFMDSAVLVLSVIAQWLLMARRMQSWLVWVAVNTLAVPLFASRGLHVTAALYAGFWVNAWVSWWHWRRLARAETGLIPIA